MSTLEIHAQRARKIWLPAGLAPVISALLVAADVFAEAQHQAHEAHRRCPFAVE